MFDYELSHDESDALSGLSLQKKNTHIELDKKEIPRKEKRFDLSSDNDSKSSIENRKTFNTAESVTSLDTKNSESELPRKNDMSVSTVNISTSKDLEKENFSDEAPSSLEMTEETDNFSRTGSKRKLIYVGHTPGLPDGWVIRRLQRTGGNRRGRIDTVIYSESGRRFKSMVEVQNYLELLKIKGVDEQHAYQKRCKRKNKSIKK
eukprot:CAMPEP_0172484286 /NCGR_PEP_ID=MMETSP1066-20121228/11678_1 /TAXON_ID=671091 /ORGANISM="Coscinodiscus wailesii, Strain CCMP2513" /LENGTH=204 /DNA_ID=CAMNT_0013248677 /DNA_START=195 /DNA_END=809 /DNA_ORIENTATION=+